MLFVSVMFYVLCAVAVAAVSTIAVCGFIKLSKAMFNKEDAHVAVVTVIMFIIVALVALSPLASRAEELPEDQYYKVVFIDEIEELEEELLLHGDDADHLWDWHEDYPEKDEEFFFYEFDEELSNLALRWAQENGFFIQLNKKDRIVENRIVVLTMRCSDDPNGDEVMDSYFTEFVTR